MWFVNIIFIKLHFNAAHIVSTKNVENIKIPALLFYMVLLSSTVFKL